MSLRVLIVARWYPAHDNPGRGSFVADLVEALVGAGTEVVVASWEVTDVLGPPPLARERRRQAVASWSPALAEATALNSPRSWGAGVPVARLPALRIPGAGVNDDIDAHAALLAPFGRALWARWPFDVVHAHTGLPDGLASARLAQSLGLPLIVTEHDRSLRYRLVEQPDVRAAYRRLLNEADATVAVSGHFKALISSLAGVGHEAMGVISNPVPAAFFAEPLDRPRDEHELLYVGGRKENKGMPVLLEAFAEVHAARPDVHLRLIGRSDSPQEEARWHDLAAELGVAADVSFDPPVGRTSVARAMARSALLVQPSPFESFGMIVAEALACGLPVAATRSGVEEILGDDGLLGEVANGTDAPSLAAAILRAHDRRREFPPSRLRRAVRQYEAAAVAQQTIATYRHLMRARATPPTTGAPSAASAPAQHEFRVPLVIGLRPTSADRRLLSLPAALTSRLTLVTAATSQSGQPQPTLGRRLEIDVDTDYQRELAALGPPPTGNWSAFERAWHFLRSPRAAFARRQVRKRRAALRERRQELRAATAASGISEVARAIRLSDGSWPDLLPLDVNDLISARAAIADGATVIPGTLRWLADRWDEAMLP